MGSEVGRCWRKRTESNVSRRGEVKEENKERGGMNGRGKEGERKVKRTST